MNRRFAFCLPIVALFAAVPQAFAGPSFDSLFGLDTSISAVAIDESGGVYVTGWTTDPNFPVTPQAYQRTFIESQCGFSTPPGGFPGPGDPIPCPHAFVAKINAAGTELLYATYLRGSGADRGAAIALDGEGAVYITGATRPGAFAPGCW